MIFEVFVFYFHFPNQKSLFDIRKSKKAINK
jgi:hypothetical protein